MELKVIHDYPCDADTLISLFRLPDEVKAKYQGIGAEKVRILASQGDDDRWRIQTVREVASQVPGLLKSVVGDRNQIEQSEQWHRDEQGHFRCDLTIQIGGVPLSIQGGMVISPEADGCRNTIHLSLDSKLPFLGKKLAHFAALDSERMMALEYDYLMRQCQEA
ncbi:DUF2505 domain-containing protein [Ferrimonas balearica]|uniref:DUF2505 domain-containing protein n=1 Tax=Ferrimonas balearica TaxID=44012 RepID=UPI001C994AEF|nr:DUF2505 domain-containing protein [Ferrimonas balearica]MBY5993465.1 DUF2505 domain-containing protein [Ferrimonas balearica]